MLRRSLWLGCFLALVWASSAQAKAVLSPNFELKDLKGAPLSLSQYKGKVVLVNFWATWCAPCRAETPALVRLQKRYAAKGLVILGLSMDDDSAKVKDFYRDFKMNYPVAMADLKTARAFGGVLGLPVSFLLGRDGKLQGRYDGAVAIKELEMKIAKEL